MDEEAVRKRYYDFIHAKTQGVIATVGSDGRPEAALMDIAVTPDLEIIFETTDQTRKFTNLQVHPAIAFVVGWGGSETLQYEGVADEPEGRVLDEARASFIATFPQKASHQNWPGNHYFRVRPLWVRFSNYHPPRKVEEFRFGPDEQFLRRGSWWQRLSGRMPERQRN